MQPVSSWGDAPTMTLVAVQVQVCHKSESKSPTNAAPCVRRYQRMAFNILAVCAFGVMYAERDDTPCPDCDGVPGAGGHCPIWSQHLRHHVQCGQADPAVVPRPEERVDGGFWWCNLLSRCGCKFSKLGWGRGAEMTATPELWFRLCRGGVGCEATVHVPALCQWLHACDQLQ